MDNSQEILEVLTEIRDLLKQSANQETRTKIDADDLVRQLGSASLIGPLRHYYSWNDRWSKLLEERNRRAAADTYNFVESEMPDAPFVQDQFAIIKSLVDEINVMKGSILDLGVYKGASTRALARLFPNDIIHGFDSFEGLPEDWSHVLKGAFGDVSGALPDMPDNVKLYKGWFSDTLPEWRKANDSKPISLLRVDCDIYSSTKDIFAATGDMLDPNCIIVFDELIGYWGWRAHEYKALLEFAEERNLKYEYVAYGLTYTIVRLIP